MGNAPRPIIHDLGESNVTPSQGKSGYRGTDSELQTDAGWMEGLELHNTNITSTRGSIEIRGTSMDAWQASMESMGMQSICILPQDRGTSVRDNGNQFSYENQQPILTQQQTWSQQETFVDKQQLQEKEQRSVLSEERGEQRYSGQDVGTSSTKSN
ncbi:hypothetical protein CROQUDRAFT_137112 [Cronartium quercuum f. sp. fusiforme G11]|uniref:Uncharacterized protein n=1 Tax=Cronartium quercuum f. sp. fusiforme G11 TaxID=708437 RepID=A0A9P6T5H0_9BASI|nr:hypothetical protein CROQUDRAFT_137112 [Cronartium quercuum f. sp. fusiforme G11]